MTTRLFPRSTVISGDIRVMSEDQGSPSTNLTSSGNGWPVEHLFRHELSGQLDAAAIPISFNVTAQGGTSTARVRMQYLRGGTIIEASNNSAVISTAGVHTEMLTLASVPTFQSGDILELAVEGNHSGGGGRNFQFAVNDANTHVDVELAEAAGEILDAAGSAQGASAAVGDADVIIGGQTLDVVGMAQGVSEVEGQLTALLVAEGATHGSAETQGGADVVANGELLDVAATVSGSSGAEGQPSALVAAEAQAEGSSSGIKGQVSALLATGGILEGTSQAAGEVELLLGIVGSTQGSSVTEASPTVLFGASGAAQAYALALADSRLLVSLGGLAQGQAGALGATDVVVGGEPLDLGAAVSGSAIASGAASRLVVASGRTSGTSGVQATASVVRVAQAEAEGSAEAFGSTSARRSVSGTFEGSALIQGLADVVVSGEPLDIAGVASGSTAVEAQASIIVGVSGLAQGIGGTSGAPSLLLVASSMVEGFAGSSGNASVLAFASLDASGAAMGGASVAGAPSLLLGASATVAGSAEAFIASLVWRNIDVELGAAYVREVIAGPPRARWSAEVRPSALVTTAPVGSPLTAVLAPHPLEVGTLDRHPVVIGSPFVRWFIAEINARGVPLALSPLHITPFFAALSTLRWSSADVSTKSPQVGEPRGNPAVAALIHHHLRAEMLRLEPHDAGAPTVHWGANEPRL